MPHQIEKNHLGFGCIEAPVASFREIVAGMYCKGQYPPHCAALARLEMEDGSGLRAWVANLIGQGDKAPDEFVWLSVNWWKPCRARF